jgi:hypothetical protein
VVVDYVSEFEGEGLKMVPHVRKSVCLLQRSLIDNFEDGFEYAYRKRVELNIRIKERRLGSEFVAESRGLLIIGMKALDKLPSVNTQVVSHISLGSVVYVVLDVVRALKQPHIHVVIFSNPFCTQLGIEGSCMLEARSSRDFLAK